MALVTVTVRSATNADLPAIWQLILDSYLAIVDGTHESFRDTFAKAGLACREGDLKDIEAAYQSSPWSHFWVAEAAGHGVVGCVALKRANEEEADLVCGGPSSPHVWCRCAWLLMRSFAERKSGRLSSRLCFSLLARSCICVLCS